MSEHRWGGQVITIAGIVVLAGYLGLLATFQLSKRRLLAPLEAGSRVATTSAGPIEYSLGGRGPTVLVLPGTFGGYDQALELGAPVRAGGFTVLAVSRPGYLGTPIDVGRSPAEQADAFAMLLGTLELGSVSVVAASGGGPAALELASRHPRLVERMVLIAGLSGSKAQPPARVPRLTTATDWLFGEGFLSWWELVRYEASGAQVLDAPIFGADSRARLREDPEKLAAFFRLAWFRFPPKLRAAGYLNDREQFGRFQFSRFAAITAPTLVIHGTADRNVPIEHGDRTARGIPGAEYFRIEGGDHYSSIARRDEVWARVLAFLRGASAP